MNQAFAQQHGKSRGEMSALCSLLKLPENERKERGLLYTPAEIAQQPETWKKTFELFQRQRAEIHEFLAMAGVWAPDVASRPTVMLIGAGTSDYIGQSVARLLRKTWQCDVTAVPSTDLLTEMESVLLPGRRHLCISFSRSGDSAEGVAVMQKVLAIRPDILHLVVSCNVNGWMVKGTEAYPQVLRVCLDDAVNDRGLAMTSSFSNMVILGQCLAHSCDLPMYEKIFRKVVSGGRNFLPLAADCAARLAQLSLTKACIVGSGPLRAVARESALKVLELTAGKTLTLSESALGLRHGPMAALDESTLFVCFLSGNPTVQKYEMDLLRELGRKGLVNNRVVVSGQALSGAGSLAEHFLLPSAGSPVADDYRPAVDVMFGQLLGLFFSLQWGLQPDNPSPTGAISRVVQNVTIHA